MIVYSSDRREVFLPPIPTKEKQDQLKGTMLENIVELIGQSRLGKGPSTEEYHRENKDHRDHASLTIVVEDPHFPLHILLNRPGLFVWKHEGKLRLTMTPSVVNKWYEYGYPGVNDSYSHWVRENLTYLWRRYAPRLIDPGITNSRSELMSVDLPIGPEIRVTRYIESGLAWILNLRRFDCKISLRILDEIELAYHPLLQEFLDMRGGPTSSGDDADKLLQCCEDTEAAAEYTHEMLLDHLGRFAKRMGREGVQEAADGFLGLGLKTGAFVTATIGEWEKMGVTEEDSETSRVSDDPAESETAG